MGPYQDGNANSSRKSKVGVIIWLDLVSVCAVIVLSVYAASESSRPIGILMASLAILISSVPFTYFEGLIVNIKIPAASKSSEFKRFEELPGADTVKLFLRI